MRYVFAGDRQVAVDVLRFLVDEGYPPEVAILPESGSHRVELSRLAGSTMSAPVWPKSATMRLRGDNVDYLICVHYPHLVPSDALAALHVGAINLHPAYLPYNRGWHTPSWAILDGTPYGATLHFMTGKVDAGPIIARRRVAVEPDDTAHTLYQRVLGAEVELFKEALPLLLSGDPPRVDQDECLATTHRKKDLADEQELTAADLEVVNRLRALTTNRWDEAAYFMSDGRRVSVRVEMWADEKLP